MKLSETTSSTVIVPNLNFYVLTNVILLLYITMSMAVQNSVKGNERLFSFNKDNM